MTMAQLLKDMCAFVQAAGDLVICKAGTSGIVVAKINGLNEHSMKLPKEPPSRSQRSRGKEGGRQR